METSMASVSWFPDSLCVSNTLGVVERKTKPIGMIIDWLLAAMATYAFANQSYGFYISVQTDIEIILYMIQSLIFVLNEIPSSGI